MKISDIIRELNCTVENRSTSEEDIELTHVIASDLMSDVLTDERVNVILITSLCSEQAIRTADLIDCACVIIVKDKKVLPGMKKLAQELNLTLLSTELRKFEASVKLGCLMGTNCGE